MSSAARLDFSRAFSVAGLPSQYVTSALAKVSESAALLAEARAAVGGAFAPIDLAVSSIEAFADAGPELILDPLGLATRFQSLADEVLSARAKLSDVAKRGVRATTDATQLYENRAAVKGTTQGGAKMQRMGADDAVSAPATAFAIREAENVAAMNRLVRVSATATLARAATLLPFTSLDEALAFREMLAAQVDELLGTVDDDTFASLTLMSAAAGEHLARVASTLPELRRYVVPAEVSTILVAHWLYGDARRADEIVARNAPRHPGLLVTGSELEVTA